MPARWKSNRGQIAVMFALLTPLLLGFVGLVVDGGLAMIQYRRGQVALDSAALAAATQLDRDLFRTDNIVELTPADAHVLAMTYASENGEGHVSVTGISVYGTQVDVYGVVTSRTVFLRIFGINQVRFDLSARAELTYGITEEGQ